jgi:chorismate mutase/prephenate dehydrogenase
MKSNPAGWLGRNNGTEALNCLRDQIEEVDREFVRLLAKRQQLALRIINYKMDSVVPLRNYSVEKQVIERFSKLCEEQGLRTHWGVGLAQYLIDKSLELQSGELDKRRLTGAFDFLVIGGHGKMGKWFCNFLRNQGHRVVVHDKIVDPDSQFDILETLDETVRDFDFVILSVPLEKTPEILERIIRLQPHGVVFDLCSVKRDVLPVIRRGIRGGLHLTSIHPLFGPDVSTLHGRNIIICPCGDIEADTKVREMFSETAANLSIIPPEKHDRLMTLTLGLSHALNLVFARALVGSGERFQVLDGVGSSTFNRQTATSSKVVRENLELYFEIQRQCDSGLVFRLLEGAVAELGEAIAENRREAFLRIMGEARDYFAERDGSSETAGHREIQHIVNREQLT